MCLVDGTANPQKAPPRQSFGTANANRIIETVGASLDPIDEDTLRFGWPGSLHESVDTAFNGLRVTDPDGALRTFRGFKVNPIYCDGDSQPSPMRVVRPPVGSDPSVRQRLHAAADFAHTDETHYRVFAYSWGNIAFPAPDNAFLKDFRAPDGNGSGEEGLPSVSTIFLWHALKSTGLTLEGDTLESAPGGQGELEMGAHLPKRDGITDGLYFYSEDEIHWADDRNKRP